jgi:hypothetical protein
LDLCLVYRPAPPKLFKLNPTAWLLLTLADGRDGASIAADYAEATGTPMIDRVRGGLEALTEMGLVEREHRQGGQR